MIWNSKLENEKKTNNGVFISSYECDPKSCDQEFLLSKREYQHIHNHIIYNSTDLSCERKWRNFFFSTNALQKVSDLVCIEHGLSVITPRPYGERSKYYNAAFTVRAYLNDMKHDFSRWSL